MNMAEMNVSAMNVSTTPRAVCTRWSRLDPMMRNTPMRWNPTTTSMRHTDTQEQIRLLSAITETEKERKDLQSRIFGGNIG